MRADKRFKSLDQAFWANVRSVSQKIGYTNRAVRGSGSGSTVKIPTLNDCVDGLRSIGLNTDHLLDSSGDASEFGSLLLDYYKYRANALNKYVEPRLMDVDRARHEFERLRKKYSPNCPLPMNKQKGAKKAHAYLTCIVNMIVEHYSNGGEVDYDPRELTTVTRDDRPLRTLSRRLDGAYPSTVNPIAVWEIKEYYYTTTFGSRVADGVYESQLDGMELRELLLSEGINVEHLLILDSHFTWWVSGKSYLCRIIDMLHMGYVDEVLFGYETVEQLGTLVQKWTRSNH